MSTHLYARVEINESRMNEKWTRLLITMRLMFSYADKIIRVLFIPDDVIESINAKKMLQIF